MMYGKKIPGNERNYRDLRGGVANRGAQRGPIPKREARDREMPEVLGGEVGSMTSKKFMRSGAGGVVLVFEGKGRRG